MKFNYWHNFEETGIYHIYNHAVGTRNLFDEDDDYNTFLQGFTKYFGHIFDIYAYCLMPNHFHLCVGVKSEESIKHRINAPASKAELEFLEGKISLNKYANDQFRRWFSGFTLRINSKYATSGPLFLKKVKRVGVDEEKKLEYMICYIHHNPIHHKFCGSYSAWKYCSYNVYLSDQKSRVSRDKILGLFDGKKGFIKKHEKYKIDFNNNLNLE